MVSKKKENCCSTDDVACCKVEALITIDHRGQMILPKDIRQKANIQAGDKLALATWESGGRIRCITLTKADELNDIVRSTVGPVIGDIK